MSANPVEDSRGSFRRSLQRIAGSAVALGAAALKWAFVFGKFFDHDCLWGKHGHTSG